jgi:hypothetical protein
MHLKMNWARQPITLALLAILAACSDSSDHSPHAVSGKDFCNLDMDLAISGVVQADGLVEASGLAQSQANRSVLWLINDRGNPPQLFALNTDGSALGNFIIDVEMNDWEDLAMAPTEDGQAYYIFIADIGDNWAQQDPALERENIVVHRFREPDLSALTLPFVGAIGIDKIDSMTLRYPDGKAHNAETLLVDPNNLDIYIVTKESDKFSIDYNGPSQVYRAPSRFQTNDEITMDLMGEIDFATLNTTSEAALAYMEVYPKHNALATAGDISIDRNWLGIATYGSLWIWPIAENQSITEALSFVPCEGPTALVPKIESFAFDPDSESYTVLNETVEVEANIYSL